MSNKLTKKEKGFIKDYVKTGNATKAILNNYDTDDENVAGSMGSQNLGKLKIQEAIKSIADRIPDELLEKVHLEGLNATEGVFDKPDYSVRHKYLDSGYKLKGAYAPEKKDITTLGEKLPSTDLDALAEIMSQQLKETKI